MVNQPFPDITCPCDSSDVFVLPTYTLCLLVSVKLNPWFICIPCATCIQSTRTRTTRARVRARTHQRVGVAHGSRMGSRQRLLTSKVPSSLK